MGVEMPADDGTSDERSCSTNYPPKPQMHELTFKTKLPTPYPLSESYPSPPKLYISPFEWSPLRKAFTTALCCTLAAIGGYATGTINPSITWLTDEFHQSSTVLLTGTTTYAAAFALGPMFFSPFSEIRGRKPVFLLSGFLFAIANLGCGLTESFAGLLVARFFSGLFSSTFSTMVGGMVADIYRGADRNTPMAIFAASCFIGTGTGLIISSAIDYHVPWRWSWYALAIACFVLSFASIFLLDETRENILLVWQANNLNKYYFECEALGCQGWLVSPQPSPSTSYSTLTTPSPLDPEKRDSAATLAHPSSTSQPVRVRWFVAGEESKLPLLASIRISVIRPFRLLFTEPIVFWFSMWIAFAWAVFYLALAAIELTFHAAYPSLNLEETGAVYTAVPVAAILGALLHIGQEHVRGRYFPPAEYTPERRLDFATWESLLFPIGLFWWGWTCRESVHWIVPTMGLCVMHVGTYTIFLTVLNYTADTYHRWSSSALAAQSMTRNIFGATLPLATQRMFASLGTGGALSLLGGLALLLSVVPWVLLRYGTSIRARSKMASEIMKTA